VIDRVSSLFDPTKILIDPSSLYRFLSGDTSPFMELGAPSRLSKEIVDNIRTLLDKLLPMIHFQETNGTEKLATDFGSVPVSELSEGYKSMLAWLAHLIVHLLRAVNWRGNIDVVKGIVLIDEVDLHLHPGWQQEVIPLLRECFPNLQFIGCTHSPMTVGGIDDGDIILLVREGSGITVEQDLPSIRGWRADQILTSPIFGLKTSRDKRTNDMLEEYKKLISLTKLSQAQEERLRYLRETISADLPTAGETEIQREAFRIIEKTMEDYFNKQTPERKQKLYEEIKRQLQR
jgi:predicted ATP-binding protein involved in virulence